jgi:outer membrane protein OmpA-like peptidoglycan-associated protein
MKRIMLVVTLAVFVVAAFGCSRMQKGAAIGGVAGGAVGAGIGKATGSNTAVAAIIGAAVGGAAGAYIGRQMDKQAEEIDRDLEGATVERIGEGIKITFDSGILFDVNKADLRPAAQTNLQNLATILNKYPDTDVLVEGHTDSTGSEEWNLELSKMRAESVSHYLTQLAVSSSRFSVMGYGEAQPVASNETTDGRQANRRVELAIMANEKLKDAAERQAAG